MLALSKRINIVENKKSSWVEKRCPHCNSLLFEKDIASYELKSVRIKCRKCKEVMEV